MINTHFAIKLESISKEFSIWKDRPNDLKRLLINLITFNFNFGKTETVKILHNLTFTIEQGEFVGIMGKNGAGKSTIMKLISGIYKPTTGVIQINGKIAPLLELGAGFSDELSGFDNIFLNASILGFNRSQTNKSLQSIIEFSELGDRIHTPVRNYSSGMLVKLGFSIAVHLDAPVLLFDEILAVGDLAFQQKCLNKIKDLYSQGRSIILVTHNPEQVVEFCSRCIVIDKGRVAFDGSAKDGAQFYRQIFN